MYKFSLGLLLTLVGCYGCLCTLFYLSSPIIHYGCQDLQLCFPVTSPLHTCTHTHHFSHIFCNDCTSRTVSVPTERVRVLLCGIEHQKIICLHVCDACATPLCPIVVCCCCLGTTPCIVFLPPSSLNHHFTSHRLSWSSPWLLQLIDSLPSLPLVIEFTTKQQTSE